MVSEGKGRPVPDRKWGPLAWGRLLRGNGGPAAWGPGRAAPEGNRGDPAARGPWGLPRALLKAGSGLGQGPSTLGFPGRFPQAASESRRRLAVEGRGLAGWAWPARRGRGQAGADGAGVGVSSPWWAWPAGWVGDFLMGVATLLWAWPRGTRPCAVGVVCSVGVPTLCGRD